MKILLRSPNWIGDCVMSLPAVRALKVLMPEAEILIITKAHLSSIYKNIPEISEIIEIPQGKRSGTFLSLIRILRSYRIREGILLTNSFRSALIMRLSGVRNLTGYSKDLRGLMLRKKKKFNGKSIHQIRSYNMLIELYLERKVGDFPNSLFFSEKEKESALNILKDNGFAGNNKLIGISPAAAYGPSKEWPVNNFAELIQTVSREVANTKFVIFGSVKDEEKIKRIIDSVSEKVIVITGSYSLREAITIISFCDVFVGNDSGLLHTADGAGVPSIGIFGPTSPGITSPPGDKTELIYKSVECSPCSFRVCPIDHKCMNRISVSEISGKIINLLKPLSR